MCRRMILGLVACAGMVANSGCLNPFTNTQKTPTEQKANPPDNVYQAVRNYVHKDEPSQTPTERVHGGIID